MDFDYSAHNALDALIRLGTETERGITFSEGAGNESFITYSAFFKMVRCCLTGLRGSGLAKGDEVMIRVEDPRSFLIVFWACMAGGMIPVPLAAGGQADHLRKARAIWEQLSDPWIIGKAGVSDEMEAQRFLDVDRVMAISAASMPASITEPGEIAYIQYSSGSTGSPKGVVLTHGNICANVAAILKRSQVTDNDSMLSWMPLTHDMGMICFHLSGIFAGINQYILPTGLFIRRPLLWMQIASEKKVTQLYSPNFGLQFFLSALQKNGAGDWDLSAIRIIYNGAEQISARLCCQFIAALQPYRLKANVMFPGYGLAEASVAVTLPDPGDPLRTHVVQRVSLKPGYPLEFSPDQTSQPCFLEVGYAVPDCNIRITHAGKILPEGYMGNIEIRGKNVTQGYHKLPALTKELFSADNWLKTCDLGFLIQGRLVITGRSKNLIIKNGFNYFQHDLEAILLKIRGMQPGNLVVTSCWNSVSQQEEILAFVVFKNDLTLFPVLQDQLFRMLLQETGLILDRIVPVKKLPKTTSGKIQNFRLTEAYLNGHYDNVLSEIEMYSASRAGTLRELIGKTFGQWVPDFSWNTDLQRSGLNSLQMLRLSADLTKATGRHLTIADLYAHPTPADILAFLQAADPETEPLPPISRADPQPTYPVLLSQRKMWIMEQDATRKGVFNLSFLVSLPATAHQERLESTFAELLEQHESLRTNFIWDTSELRQFVTPYSGAPSIKWLDIEEKAKETAFRQEANTPFDIGNTPLIRIIVWRTGRNDLLQLTIHHLITDGWSIQLLLQEFAHLYFSNSPISRPLPSERLQFKDYCCWHDSLNNSTFFRKAEEYWIDEFRKGFPPLQLPFHRTSKRPTLIKDDVYTVFEPGSIEKIDSLTANAGLSRFTILLALLHSIFYRHSRQGSIVTGIEAANRSNQDCASIAGPLINTLLIKSELTQRVNLKDLSAQLQDKLLKGLEYESYSFDHLTTLLEQHGIDHQVPLFNTLVIYHNFTNLFDGPLAIPGDQVKIIETSNALCDLVVEFFDAGATLELRLHYDTGIFEKNEIDSFLDHFQILSESLLNDPHLPIDDATLLSKSEIAKLIEISRGRTTDAAPSFTELLNSAISLYPEQTAIVHGDSALTYRELKDRMGSLACRLTDEYGVGPGMFIALLAGPGERTILLMLAIWKAGAIYVPIDPGLPEQRIRFILNDSRASLVITDVAAGWLKAGYRVADTGYLFDQPIDRECQLLSSPELACALYTSGTTGYPKGMAISHDSLADYTQTFTHFFNITEKDIVVQQAAVHFDISLEEILPVLSKGGKLVIAPGGGRDVHALLDLIDKEQVTVLTTTPAVIREIDFINPTLHSLRLLISGGEGLERNDLTNLAGRHFEIYNTYGPSETTLCATYNKVEPGDQHINIGLPIDNREIYLLDEQLHLVPLGEIGEICIGGRGLARYYLNQPELTREKFVPKPFIDDGLIYRSGDLGRWLPDNRLDFLGRKDDQLKIRGYRIECEEITRVINRLGNCRSIVLASKDGSGEYYLSAYISGISPGTLTKLKLDLPTLLPEYMIPATFTLLDELPLNVNGKVDRAKLPAGRRNDSAATDRGPETITRDKLARLWRETLDVIQVYPDSDFLMLGGHSLKIVRLISRISKEFLVRISLKDFFEHRVLNSMASYIDGLIPVQFRHILKTPAAQSYELSHEQRRLWILDRIYSGNTAYNIVIANQLRGRPGLDKLTDVLLSIVDRYESLRTVFFLVGDQPRQVVLEPGIGRLSLHYEDLRTVPDTNEIIAACTRQETAFHFDLVQGPLFRAHIFQIDDARFTVLLNIHHIVCDGWSMELIWKELLSGLTTADPTSGTPENLQYRDYTEWQNQLIRSGTGRQMREFWKSKLGGKLQASSFPTDYPRPPEKTFRGAVLKFIVPADIRAGLHDLHLQGHTSMYTVLLAAVCTLLFKETTLKDIVLGTATVGRDHIDLEGLVGIFANTMPVRIAIPERGSFTDLVQLVHEYLTDTHEYRGYPFDLLIEDLGIQRDLSRYPLFDVLVNYDDRTIYHLFAQSHQLIHLPVPQTTSKFDLTFQFEEGDQLMLNLEYAVDLYRDSTIMRYYTRFENLLRTLLTNPDIHLSAVSLQGKNEQPDSPGHIPAASPTTTAKPEPSTPPSPISEDLASIWKEVLMMNELEPDDDFFQLGGNSIAALKIIHAINDRFNIDFKIKDVFEHSTLRKMSRALNSFRGVTPNPIQPAPPAKYYPLSHGQYRLLSLNTWRPVTAAYNLPAVFRLQGPFLTEIFISAIRWLIGRHDSLRTAFVWKGGKPWQQVIAPDKCNPDIFVEDRRGHNADTVMTEIAEHHSEAFDLEQAPLIRIRIIRIDEEIHLLSLNIHHIICDAWSIGVMVRELSDYYTSLLANRDPRFAPPKLQYKDFVLWQRSPEQHDRLQQHRSFWVDYLRDADTSISPPTDFPRPGSASGNGDQYRHSISIELSDRLRHLAESRNAGLYLTFLSLIKVLLVKYSGQRDITVGIVVAGRELSELKHQVGFYVNTIPMRTLVDLQEPFAAFLEKERQHLHTLFQHQDYPLDLMIEESVFQPKTGQSNIFDVVVNYQSANQQPHFSLPGLSVEALTTRNTTSKFDLTFDILAADAVVITTEYNTDIYKRDTVIRLIDHLQHLASQICDNPSISLSSLLLPTPAEQLMIRTRFNPASTKYPGEETVVSLFLAQAGRSADALALVEEGTSLSYAELNRMSNRMSRCLTAEYEILAGTPVALIADHGIAGILCILAILKAGGIYVPIDIDWPKARIESILEDVGAKLVLSDGPCQFKTGIRTVKLEDIDDSLFSGEDVTPSAVPADIAYIMYTSGSTGRPKGVAVSHRNIIRLLCRQNYIWPGTSDRLLQTGSLAFDASTFEIWAMLLHGGELHLLPKEKLMDPSILKQTIRTSSINTMWFTSAWFNQLADIDASLFAPLKTLLVGGDRLSVPHIGKVKRLNPEIRIVNGYGPTEATTFSTCHEIIDNDLLLGQIPIGRPIHYTEVYILDDYLNLQPVGVVGEICIAGEGLSGGYWNEEELTGIKFADHPFRGGEKIYRSGDLGYWREDGCIMIKGRKDDQVKINGYRVECGEVGCVLQQAGAQLALVLPRRDPEMDTTWLVAYVSGVPMEARETFSSQVRSILPGYMVPSAIIYVDKFDVNSNGKIDRNLLPAIEVPRSGRQKPALGTETQRVLASLWEEVLGVKGIGPDDNFFDLGGHSLKGLRLIGLLASRLNRSFTFRDIFANPVLSRMAAILEKAATSNRHISPAPLMENYPLSFNQYGIWVAGQKTRDQQAYNILGAYKLTGIVNTAVLTRAFELLMTKHHSLRTIFCWKDMEIRQRTVDLNQLEPAIINIDWSSLTDPSKRITDLMTQEMTWCFDLYRGPLLRIHIVHTAAEEVTLVINMHHIIADGWSMDILVRDIRQYYSSLMIHPDFKPDALKIHYKDFACWQREWINAEDFEKARKFWLDQFPDGITDLDLARLSTVRRQTSLQSGQITIEFDQEITARIQNYVSELHISHYVFFLACWNVLLYKMTHQGKFVVATPIADRAPDLLDQIGYYVNTVLINAEAADGMIVKDLLRSYRNTISDVLQYREYPINILVEKIRDLQLPVSDDIYSVGFSWFVYAEDSWDLDNVKVTALREPGALPKCKLWLSGSSLDGAIQFSLIFDPANISEEIAGLLKLKWLKVIAEFIRHPEAALGNLDIRLEEELALESITKYQEISFDF